MKSRFFHALSLISTVLLACTFLLWLWSFWTDPRRDCLSFASSFHVAVQGGRISFFNNKEFGPYRGSILTLRGREVFSELHGFGDTFGIYYRYFRWAESASIPANTTDFSTTNWRNSRYPPQNIGRHWNKCETLIGSATSPAPSEMQGGATKGKCKSGRTIRAFLVDADSGRYTCPYETRDRIQHGFG
jgi:hypothetical protein